MPRLKHVVTGVVVDVSDAKAALVSGGAYVSVDQAKEAKPKRPATSDEK